MFTQSFKDAWRVTSKWEGGYVNNPHDRGGETNRGISKRSYPNEDIKNMTEERAMYLAHRDYWTVLKCDTLHPSLAMVAFDASFNQGVSRASRWLKETENYTRYCSLRMKHYISLKDDFKHFGRGWMNRLADVQDEAAAIEEKLEGLPTESDIEFQSRVDLAIEQLESAYGKLTLGLRNLKQ